MADEQLVVQLEARIRDFERNFERANRVANDNWRGIENRGRQAAQRIEGDLGGATARINKALEGIGKGFNPADLFKGVAAGISIAEIARLGTEWQKVGNQIAAAGVPMNQVADVQNRLVGIAERTRSGLAETTSLYATLTRSSKELGASQSDIASVTETVAKSLKISGADAQETSAAILQLGQALGSGKLQGDELRSLLENAPVLAQSIAKGFNTTVPGLRDLGSQGKLTSDGVFRAILASANDINAAFEKTTPTISDAFKVLEVNATKFVGTSNIVKTSMGTVANAVTALGRNFDTVGTGAAALGAVIASRLLAAGISPLAVGLNGATAAVSAFVPSMAALAAQGGAAAVALRLFSGALALVGGVPGAVILGLGAALIYATNKSAEGADVSKRYAAALDEIKPSGDRAKGAIEGVGAAVQGTAAAMQTAASQALTNSLRTMDTDARDLTTTLRGMIQDMQQFGAINVNGDEKARAIAALTAALDGDAKAALSATQEIDALGMVNPSFASAFAQFANVLVQLAAIRSAAAKTRAELAGVNNANAEAGIPRPIIDYGQVSGLAQNDPTLKALAGQGTARRALIDAQMDETKKKYRDKEQELRETILKGGGVVPDNIQSTARKIVDAEDAGKGGKGGSGGAKKNDFDREEKSMERRIRELNAEAAAVGKSGEAAAKAEASTKLLQAAQDSGIAITDELKSKVNDLAEKYAKAKVGLDQAKDAQAKMQQTQQFFASSMVDSINGLLFDGRSLSETFENLAKSIGKAAIQAALLGNGPLAGLLGGNAGGSSGGVGGLLGFFLKGFSFGGLGGTGTAGLWADGGYTGQGGKWEPAGVVHRGEYVFSASAVKAIGVGNLDAMHSNLKGYADGGFVGAVPPVVTPSISSRAGVGGVNVTNAITLNTNGGGTKEQNADMAKQVSKHVEAITRATVADELRKQMRPGALLNH